MAWMNSMRSPMPLSAAISRASSITSSGSIAYTRPRAEAARGHREDAGAGPDVHD
jgi:hypothetical protein